MSPFHEKSTAIALCLLNLHGIDIAQGEDTVAKAFQHEHPDNNFADWNQEIEDGIANKIIHTLAPAKVIHVEELILDLWNESV